MAKINLVGNIPDGQIFTVTVVNHSEWALLKQGKYQVFSGKELDIPIDFLYGSDYTCVAVTNPHNLWQGGIHTAPITADTTIHLSDTKYRVEVINEDLEGVEVAFPPYKFAERNSAVNFSLTYSSQCDANTESISTNSTGAALSENTLTITASEYRTYCRITKKTHSVNFIDEVAWTSTESKVYENIRHGGSLTIPITYRDSASYSYLKTLEGYQVGSSGIVLPNVTEDVRVTASENRVQIKSEVESGIVSVSPSIQYANFNSTGNLTLYVSYPFSTSDITTDKGSISGSILSIPTTNTKYETVKIGDNLVYKDIGVNSTDKSTSSTFPVCTNYKYSQSEFIYTADEIGRSGTIRGIGFYITSLGTGTYSRYVRIYVGHTTSDYFTGSNYSAFTSAGQNYEGNYVFKLGWNFIPFNLRTFSYDGTSNLVILVNDNTGSYRSSNYFQTYYVDRYRCAYIRSDSTSYYPNNIYSYNTYRYKPVLRLNFA